MVKERIRLWVAKKKSIIKIKKRVGDKTESLGSPTLRQWGVDLKLSRLLWNEWSDKNLFVP